jgi:N-methylhydantoinase A/oxoprolinase/acetone carboxylase beta subunit
MSTATNDSFLIGIDVGGTFTDCVLVDGRGGT